MPSVLTSGAEQAPAQSAAMATRFGFSHTYAVTSATAHAGGDGERNRRRGDRLAEARRPAARASYSGWIPAALITLP